MKEVLSRISTLHSEVCGYFLFLSFSPIGKKVVPFMCSLEYAFVGLFFGLGILNIRVAA